MDVQQSQPHIAPIAPPVAVSNRLSADAKAPSRTANAHSSHTKIVQSEPEKAQDVLRKILQEQAAKRKAAIDKPYVPAVTNWINEDPLGYTNYTSAQCTNVPSSLWNPPPPSTRINPRLAQSIRERTDDMLLMVRCVISLCCATVSAARSLVILVAGVVDGVRA